MSVGLVMHSSGIKRLLGGGRVHRLVGSSHWGQKTSLMNLVGTTTASTTIIMDLDLHLDLGTMGTFQTTATICIQIPFKQQTGNKTIARKYYPTASIRITPHVIIIQHSQ